MTKYGRARRARRTALAMRRARVAYARQFPYNRRGKQISYLPGGLASRYIRNMFDRVDTHILSDWDQNFIVSDPTAVQTGGIVFQLDALPNSAEIAALYDQYKIHCVELTFAISGIGVAVIEGSSATTSTMQTPTLFVAVDTSDSAAPASINAILEYGSVAQRSLSNCKNGVVYKLRVYPKVRTGLLEDGGTIVASGTTRPWISTTRADIQHFGVKYALSNTGTGSSDEAWTIDLYTKVVLKCKNNQ